MKSYFKFLSRNKLFTFIEGAGLSVSLGFVLILVCYARTEFRVGAVRPESQKIYVVGRGDGYGMTKGTANAFFPAVPEIESWTRFARDEDEDLTCNDDYYKVSVAAADSNFFNFFSYEIDGCPRSEALRTRDKVLISKSFASKVFGTDSPVGRPLKFRGETFTVAGTVVDMGPLDVLKPCDVWFRFDVLRQDYAEMDNFGTTQTFVTLRDGASPEAVAEKLLDSYTQYWDFYDRDDSQGYFLWGSSLVRWDEVYLGDFNGAWDPFRFGSRSKVNVLLALAMVLLVSAVLNYINLTVAQVGKRAPEMAVRRLNGDTAAGIRRRYMAESLIFTFAAGAVGLLLAVAAKPYFESVLGTAIVMQVDFASVGVFVVFLLIVSLLCALIPSVLASRFQPIDIVKGEFRLKGKQIFSRIFIVVQCVISTCLIALSITMLAQVRHLETLPTGYNTDGLLRLSTYNIGYTWQEQQSLRDVLSALPEVESVAMCGSLPMACGINGIEDEASGQWSWINNVSVDSVGFRLLGFRVAEQFSDPLPGYYYLDREAAEFYGVTAEKQWFGRTESNPYGHCCGIVENFRPRNALSKPEDDCYNAIRMLGEDAYVGCQLVKVRGDRRAAFEAVDSACREFCRAKFGLPLVLPMQFADDELDSALDDTRNVFHLVAVFMLIAIMISSLGILAMSIYHAGRQSRHIALRKVFGADTVSAAWNLAKGVVALSAVSAVPAIPLCDMLIRRYLADFHFAIAYPWYATATAVVLTVIVTAATISANTYAAASRNPVTVLKQND